MVSVIKMKKTILCVTTDVHGVIRSINYGNNQIISGGLARYASALKKIRSEYPHVVAMDNGDTIQGTPLMTYFHQSKMTRTHPMATAFNELKIEFMNLGNHDFNYGPHVLAKYLQETKAFNLTSNILYQNSPLGSSTMVTTPYGKRIGLIGVTTDYIPNWERADYIEGFRFDDVVKTVKEHVQYLRSQVDALVVLYHGGLECDPQTLVSTERFTGENVGCQIAAIDGIDVLITGHQHRQIIEQISGTLVTQCTFNAQEFVQIELDFEETLKVSASRVSLADFPIDPTMDELIADVEEETQRWLDQTLGTLEGPSLLIEDGFAARRYKHPLVSFINQVMLETTSAQISATSLFNDPKGFNPHITMRDLVSTYVYPNTLVVKKMTGRNIKAMIEQSANYFMLNEKGEITVNPEYVYPKMQHFNYDMFDGIEYSLNISNPVGKRLVDCLYQGHPLEDETLYSVAMNNYRASGGGDFVMVAESETIFDSQREMVEIIAEYIMKHQPTRIKHSDNILISK